MLHKLNLPNDTELRNVMAFQRDVLRFACDPTINRPADTTFDKAEVEGQFVARWPTFWQSIYHGKLTAFGTAIKNLNDFVRDNNALASDILNAYDNDIQFDTRFNDSTFSFQFPLLPTNVRDDLKTILVQFYTWFSGDGGFSASVTQVSGFQRRQLVERFVSANGSINVCPACDGPRADRDESRVHASVDHYFPKGKHAPLSIHPLNLIPTCKYCNETFKGENDPTDMAIVAEMFLPYLREPFGPVNVFVRRDAIMQFEVELNDAGQTATRRLESLEHVYALKRRWPPRVFERVIPHIQESMRSLGKWLQRHNVLPPIDQDVRDTLRDQRDDFRSNRGAIHDSILFEAYAEFVLTDPDEFQTMVDECLGV